MFFPAFLFISFLLEFLYITPGPCVRDNSRGRQTRAARRQTVPSARRLIIFSSPSKDLLHLWKVIDCYPLTREISSPPTSIHAHTHTHTHTSASVQNVEGLIWMFTPEIIFSSSGRKSHYNRFFVTESLPLRNVSVSLVLHLHMCTVCCISIHPPWSGVVQYGLQKRFKKNSCESHLLVLVQHIMHWVPGRTQCLSSFMKTKELGKERSGNFSISVKKKTSSTLTISKNNIKSISKMERIWNKCVSALRRPPTKTWPGKGRD